MYNNIISSNVKVTSIISFSSSLFRAGANSKIVSFVAVRFLKKKQRKKKKKKKKKRRRKKIGFEGNSFSSFLFKKKFRKRKSTRDIPRGILELPAVVGGWVDGWMGGWVDGWVGGWADGRMVGWVGVGGTCK
jgi:hypothetical protein